LKIAKLYFLVPIYFFLFCVKILPQTDSQSQVSSIQHLESNINNIINDKFFERTTIAIDVFDLTDSIALFQKNNRLLLRPASNMKLLTSATALINLGEYYTFRTDLYHTGVIEGTTLFGDLFVVGGFDPGFTTDDLDSLVRIVKSLGITYISGGVYADISKKDSMHWGKGWMWDDDPEPSAPYLSALNLNGNSIEIFIEGGKIGSPAKVKLDPQTDFVEVVNNSITVADYDSCNFLITRDWVNRKNTILINGKVNKSNEPNSTEHKTKINLLNPERYFLTLFKEHLEQERIIVGKSFDVQKLSDNPVYLNTIYSSLDEILPVVNKDSDNLSAEMLIYAVAYEDSGAPATSVDGLAAVKRLIDSTGFNSNDYSLADGSGVSHYNLITAELIQASLKYMYFNQKNLFNLFYNSLSVASVDGTLKNRMKNTFAQNNVHAKTGTLNGVSNLSGYLTAKNGHLVSFSIMIQNFSGKSSEARYFQDKICELLSDYK
jgi:D-alanyl-D-alanine carboxypeptidase/D-alanyl-D-alanine-endopeptidase (penicillin-binding protein 4)